MAKQYTLGKNERLKSRKQIEQLFNDGQRFNVSSFRVFYSFLEALDGTDTALQAGFAAGSRNFKTAVDRNRIKRLIKEAWRLQKNELKEQLTQQNRKLNVFFIYTGKELPAYSEVWLAVKKIATKLLDISQKRN